VSARHQHRISLAPAKPGLAIADVHDHWRTHHAQLVLGLDGLVGYVQNRALPEWWPHLGFIACPETWFEDRDSERAAFASDYYRDELVPDEERTLARGDVWSSPVTAVEELHPGTPAGLRVLAFGGAAANLEGVLLDGRAEVLHLGRPAPGTTDPRVVSVFAGDEANARHLALRLGGVAFVAEAAVLRTPPVAPWSAADAPVPSGARP
jgi:hypothetical protein